MVDGGWPHYEWSHSILSGEILPQFYVKNTFLAKKLAKLEHLKEIPENFIEKSLKIPKIKSTNVFRSFFEPFYHVKQCLGRHTQTLDINPERPHS